jgi:MFS family permease
MTQQDLREGVGREGRSRTLYLVILMATVCLIYSISQFLRNSVGVIAPDLIADIGFTPDGLGILSGAFFFSFALAQIPLGIALDRYGPRLCMTSSIGLAVAGSFLFAYGNSPVILTTARVLLGFGCSGLLMGPFTLFSRWFATRQFSTMVGIILSVGTIGTLMATTPLAWAAQTYGWRGAFVLVGGIVIAAGILGWLILRDAPPGDPFHDRKRDTLLESIIGVREVIKVPDFWPVFTMYLVSYGSFVTLLGLWGGPYLFDIHGFDIIRSGNYLFVLATAQIIGLFLWGPIDRLTDSCKRPVMTGVLVSAVLMAVLAVWPQMPVTGLIVLFILYGLVTAYIPVMTSHGRRLFPQHLIGRGLTLLNMSLMGGVFLMQVATGYIMAAFAPVVDADGVKHNSLAAYQASFAFIVISLLVAAVIYARAHDRKPSQD